MKTFFLLLAAGAAAGSSLVADDSYGLENGYFLLSGSGGAFQELRMDPLGRGEYGDNLIRYLTIGDEMDLPRSYRLERNGQELIFRELTVHMPFSLDQESIGYPREIEEGGSAGIAFEAGFPFHRLEARFPTWQQHDSAIRLALYEIDTFPDDGETVLSAEAKPVAETTIENVVDNAWTRIDFGRLPAGRYYLEATRVRGRVGWWGIERAANPHMVAVEDGRARADADFTLRVHGAQEFKGTWFVFLQGRDLVSRFFPDAAARSANPDNWQTLLVMPWDNSGYDLDFFPFERFYNSVGQHIFPQQLKRRPFSNQIRAHRWFRCVGREGAGDLLFEFNTLRAFEGPAPFQWRMESDALRWEMGDTHVLLRALPARERLPEMFPRFLASDEAYAEKLTDFYLGHGLNWGANTAGEWKEWDGVRLSWTANPQALHHADQLLRRPLSAEGYFWTWAGRETSYLEQIGWPFPFRDENADGLNDYDTRHFTTNSALITGIARHALWSRDRSFLNRALPRARWAMEYQLQQLQGMDGLILPNAEGRNGRNGGHGSNYWDILPFGHKDGYSNIYFFHSINRMAELEELAASLLTPEELDLIAAPEPRAPQWYRAHASKVKQVYGETFWDDGAGRFIGCIDIDGNRHDYGFVFLNLEAIAHGLATGEQVRRIYNWLENEPTSSGEADTFSRWVFAPRATTIHNPPPDAPQEPKPTWRFSGWAWGDWEVQCQDGGAILYTSAYDLISRARYFGADNADRRMREILERWAEPCRLMGGSPLYRGEITQGGPGGTAGQVGVEGEFPESGMVPASFLWTVLGLEPKADGLHVRPDLPSSLDYAGMENLRYAGQTWRVVADRGRVRIEPMAGGPAIDGEYDTDGRYVFRPWETGAGR